MGRNLYDPMQWHSWSIHVNTYYTLFTFKGYKNHNQQMTERGGFQF